MSTNGQPEIDKLFAAMAKNKASDMHLKADAPPIFRVGGHPRDVGSKALSGDDIRKMVYEILSDMHRDELEEQGDIDFAHTVEGVGRFRINLYRQRGNLSMAARRVESHIPSFDELRLPKNIVHLTKAHQGLVLVCGVTGSGKSTTLASFIEYINQRQRKHIVTIEDPIEYLYEDKKAFINQRELGLDVASWSRALRSVVRQDPDVILVGEMRDAETFQAGLTAAETGHLVLGTMHTSNAAQTVARILDLFPEEKHGLIRQGMAANLKGIVCQKLLPSIKEGVSVVPVVELMITNATVRKLITDEEDGRIGDAIRGAKEMQDFTQSLVDLVQKGLLSKKVARQYAPNPDQFEMNLKGIYLSEDKGII